MTTFCFLDIETTGIDPDTDEILEVAWQFADERFEPVGSSRRFLIEPDWAVLARRVREDGAVKDMHTRSGLLEDLYRDELVDMDVVAEALLDDVARYATGSLHFAGFSVGFDRAFLRAKGLRSMIERTFHHRLLDLSALRLLLDVNGFEYAKPENPCPHRALYDVNESITQARMFANDLTRVFV